MLSVECSFFENNLKARLSIFDDHLLLDSLSIPYCSLKSIHVKNDSGSYLLKLKLDGHSPILLFSTLHLRDMVKSIILDRLRIAQSIPASVLSSLSHKKSLRSVKGFVSETHFHSLIDSHDSLFFQTSPGTITSDNFFRSINQPLLDVFIKMNCSIDQFYNLFVSSYFYDIKNQKNALDRLLNESLRDFGPALDYATRINTQSLLNLANTANCAIEPRSTKGKSIEFLPSYAIKPDLPPEDFQQETVQESQSFFVEKPLSAKLTLEIPLALPDLAFDPADFETAGELCKIVFLHKNEKAVADSFSPMFLSFIEGKYGKEALKYVERLNPLFYKNDQ